MDDHREERLCFNVRPGTTGAGTTGRGSVSTRATLAELLAVGHRHERLVVRTFAAVFIATAAFVLLRPASYESEMKLLVKQERLDPLPTEDSSRSQAWQNVTEEQLMQTAERIFSRGWSAMKLWWDSP